MKSKSRGFTVIEVVIALAITTVVLGVIGTFFITSTNTLSDAEVKSTLQSEGEAIQTQLYTIGQQSNGIEAMSKWTASGVITSQLSNTVFYSEFNDPKNPNSIVLNELKVKIYTSDSTGITAPFDYYYFKLEGSKLTLVQTNSTPEVVVSEKVLSENVESFSISPLDAASITVPNRSITSFKSTKAIEVNINLHIKRGYTDVTYPISTIIKFRNMGVDAP